MATRSWIQCPVTLKLIPREEYCAHESAINGAPAVHGDIESFVSPVDGSIVTDRAQLREHNIRNGVINHAEYGQGHWDRHSQKRKEILSGNFDKKQRIEDIKKSHHQHTYGLPGVAPGANRHE